MSEFKNRKPKTCMEKDEEIIASSEYSLSAPNPDDSSSMMFQRSQLETKKKMVPKKPCSFKFKAKKQVVSENPRKFGSYKRRRTRIDDLYDDDDAKISVMEQGEEVLKSIPAKFPSFLKHMLPSNVSYSFWMILPKQFCDMYMPSHDESITLVDECGKEYKTTYLIARHGLSAGWRGFSIDHRLLKGDILVFHLVGRWKFKVNIVRVYGLDEVDAALCLMYLDAFGKRTDSDQMEKGNRTHKKAKKRVETLLLDIAERQEEVPNNDQGSSNSKLRLIVDRSESHSDDFRAEVPEVVDSEITNQHHSNELSCCGSYLIQDHFRKGIDCR